MNDIWIWLFLLNIAAFAIEIAICLAVRRISRTLSIMLTKNYVPPNPPAKNPSPLQKA